MLLSLVVIIACVATVAAHPRVASDAPGPFSCRPAAPMHNEFRVAGDGRSYSLAEFRQYYGERFESKWEAAEVETAVMQEQRVAGDGELYTLSS